MPSTRQGNYQQLQETDEEKDHYVTMAGIQRTRQIRITIVLVASLCLNALMGVYVVTLLFREQPEGLSKFGELTQTLFRKESRLKGEQRDLREISR